MLIVIIPKEHCTQGTCLLDLSNLNTLAIQLHLDSRRKWQSFEGCPLALPSIPWETTTVRFLQLFLDNAIQCFKPQHHLEIRFNQNIQRAAQNLGVGGWVCGSVSKWVTRFSANKQWENVLTHFKAFFGPVAELELFEGTKAEGPFV